MAKIRLDVPEDLIGVLRVVLTSPHTVAEVLYWDDKKGAERCAKRLIELHTHMEASLQKAGQ